MKKVTTIIATIMLIFATSCSKTGVQTQTKSINNSTPTTGEVNSAKGNASAIPAYYDHELLKIHFSEFSPKAEANLIVHNHNLNFIYQSDPGLPGGQPFISVIDAIPGDGFNPLWREVQIRFNAGVTPVQLFSDNDVLAAASGPNATITLDTTNEVYWCPVVGTK